MIPTAPPGGRPPTLPEPASPGHVPLYDPDPPTPGDRPPLSSGTIETLHGDMGLSTWGGEDVALPTATGQVALRLAPDQPVVIGRQEKGIPPYLDPAYRSTRTVPGARRPVVRSDSGSGDVAVSRAHFMLRGSAGGIVLTNGVPRVGGGIRPPMNGTWLTEPSRRLLEPGEDYLIGHGSKAVIGLPNGTAVQICAE